MKYRITDNQGECDYEGYNPKTRCMEKCGCKSHILAGKKYVCEDHLSFALQSDKRPEVFNFTGTEITIKKFKSIVADFKPANKKTEVIKWT